MVGYDTEDKAYCMEMTYNYGLNSYPPGTGLTEFGIFVPDISAAATAAQSLGYSVVDNVVVGPDQYTYRLLQQPEGRTERFSYVLCRSGNVARSIAFYKDFLGFSEAPLPSVAGLPANAAAVSYSTNSHPHKFEPVLLVFYEDGTTPVITPWEGRHAFALDADEVCKLHAKFKAECPERIMHDASGEPISLQEKLGTLFIFIAKDPDGYELCLVSRETMLPAAVQAVTSYDPSLLDYEVRDKRIGAIDAARPVVDKLVTENSIVVFSKAGCTTSSATKSTLEGLGAKFLPQEITDADTGLEEYLAAKSNSQGLPKVFIKGACVPTLPEGDELKQMCAAAGAMS